MGKRDVGEIERRAARARHKRAARSSRWAKPRKQRHHTGPRESVADFLEAGGEVTECAAGKAEGAAESGMRLTPNRGRKGRMR